VAAVVLALDQGSKAWAVAALDDGRVIELVWTLQLRLVGNTGASFSLGSGRGQIIGLVATAVAIALAVHGRKLPGTLAPVATGWIIGGALGNVIDRVARSDGGFLDGAVVDFIDLQWWPVFNVADMAVVCGGILLVWATRDASGSTEADGGAATSDG
jgi:signal peptidase II